MSGDERTKLVSLLKKLFQSDMADVDTGIYRIINRKRSDIERFIDKDLIDAVDSEFGKYEQKNAGDIKKELENLRKQIEEEISPGAIDEQGNLLPQFAGVRRAQQLAEQYRAKQATLKEAMLSVEHKNEVYNHIYQFFSRYYDNGDFMPLRRSSMKKKYSIPYNGEETMFYWANQDQYYIKTGEQFNNYTFRTGNYVIHFRLTAAETSTNNNKEADRYFVLASDEKDKITFDASKSELNIYFEYRALTDEEKAALSKRSAMEELILKNEQDILGAVEDFGVRNALAQKVPGEEQSLLYKHLRKYSIANKSDYFIHKNLKGFLQRELDFYIKNEMLNIDDLGTDNEIPVERYLARVKVFKAICNKVIEFLAQIEDFQRMLFEKKKFVLSTDYCMTMDLVPEDLYPEIVANKAQIDEWRKLNFLDESSSGQKTLSRNAKSGLNVKYLKENKYLVLDTKFFDHRFKDRLFVHFEDLDEKMGGLMVKSENWQALRLLENTYDKKVKCVYIDPPYNTGSDEFLYKDQYKHSSWLSMMKDRYYAAKKLMSDDSVIFTSIDDGEQANLRSLQEIVFGSQNFVTNIIWQKKYSPQNDATWFSDNHDFITCFAINKEKWKITPLPRTDEQNSRYTNRDNDPRGPWKSSDLSVKTYSVAYDYPIKTPSGRIVNPPVGRCWNTSKERMEQYIKDNRIWFGEDGNNVPSLKKFLSEVKEGRTPLTIWTYEEVGHNQEGKQELMNILSDKDLIFNTPKVVRLLKRIIQIGSDKNSLIMDFFSGSGTTAHALICLNKEDKGNRKYINVEIGDYFDYTMKSRIEKVLFASDWNDGHPASKDGTSHMFKYQSIEQYEDTLENIEFIESGSVQKTLYELDGYFLKYMLDYESRESPCRLNVTKLVDPFNYTIWVKKDGVRVEQKVDLVETFNYLIGMHVQQLLAYDNEGVYYRVVHGMVDGKPVSVVWRCSIGLDLKKDKEFIENVIMKDRKPEKLYINGEFFVQNAIPIEVDFKRLMGA